MTYMLLMIEPPEQRRSRTRAQGQALFARMQQFADELKAQGVLRGVESLAAHSNAARVQVRDGKPRVIDGPFAEAKELVAGYWIWQVDSLEEAVEWAKRCPHGPVEGESELEIRRIFEVEDFAPVATPEILEHNERLRAQVAEQQAGDA
jgi:hypothetical protein